MATYKVIQDIEAEDKLVGPLSLRQFIYAIIVAVSGFVVFKLVVSGVFWLGIPFIPIMILFAVLAAPFGRDQSSEIWLLAKIRFLLIPRKRVWDQAGAKELVTITAPKVVERHLTKEMSQTEVRSRLQALANTIDSRGWAVKNVNISMLTRQAYATQPKASDRLVDPSSMPQEVPAYEITAADDIMDEQNNPTAQMLDKMIQSSTKQRKQQLMEQMQHGAVTTTPVPAPTPIANTNPGPAATPAAQAPATSQAAAPPPPDYWFMNEGSGQAPTDLKPGYATFGHNPLVAPGIQTAPNSNPWVGPEEQALLDRLHSEQAATGIAPNTSHLKVVKPLSVQKQEAEAARLQAQKQTAEKAAMKAAADRAKLEELTRLARSNDLSVQTISHEANRPKTDQDNNEVVVNLH